MADEVVPERPDQAGLQKRDLGIVDVEPARLLANDARERLGADGFDDDQIDEWAEAFVAEVSPSASVDDLIAWIASREHRLP